MTLALRDGVSTVTTEDGMVLLDEHTGRYWQLNDNGTLILRRLLDGDTPQTCALRLVRDHPRLTEEQADTDVAALLESLRMAHLVTP
ncbi:lasso peptide biosynthesis PqqD family chaperone [Streptomyces nigrescens]